MKLHFSLHISQKLHGVPDLFAHNLSIFAFHFFSLSKAWYLFSHSASILSNTLINTSNVSILFLASISLFLPTPTLMRQS